MNAEIICIGTELLLGHIISSNASFIAKKLAELGIDHYHQTTVGDNPKRLSETIKTGLKRSDIVITTGGLGPTVDDITAQIISQVSNRKLVLEKALLKDINEYFKKQNRRVPKGSLRQALIPKGAIWLKNPFGTAAGLIIEEGQKTIIALPGPPREMQPMMDNYVMPYLKGLGVVGSLGHREILISRPVKLIGLPEPEVDKRAKDLLNMSGAVTVGIYARLGEVELKVMAKAKNKALADKEIDKIEKIIRKRFGHHVYGADEQTLEGAVGGLLLKRKKTLAVAESCTGGLISSRITDAPGSSGYFKEGLVAYANDVKTRELAVPPELIKKYGAVSAQAAKKMAEGIRKKAGADIGIGVTGIAGPAGATKEKPVGLVYIALSLRNKTACGQFNFAGTRADIKWRSAQAALNMLRCELL